MGARVDATDWLEYFVLRAVVLFVRRFSLAQVRKLGSFLGGIGYFLWRKRRRITLQNLGRIYEVNKTKSLARECWQERGETFVEFMRLPGLLREQRQFISWEGKEFLDAALRKRRGVIFLTAHLGNWELLGATIAQKYRLCVIAKHIQNPWIDKWVEKQRRDCGIEVIYIQESIKEGLKYLRHNCLLGILIDQRIHRGGLLVNFLGSPALTTPLVPLLAKRSRSPVIPFFTIREKGRYRIIFEKELVFDFRQALEIQTRQCNEIIEKWIFRWPEQWFWVHNRWKK